MKRKAHTDPLTRNIESRTANQMIKFENVGFNLDFFRRSNRMEMVLPGDDSLSTIFAPVQMTLPMIPKIEIASKAQPFI